MQRNFKLLIICILSLLTQSAIAQVTANFTSNVTSGLLAADRQLPAHLPEALLPSPGISVMALAIRIFRTFPIPTLTRVSIR